MLKAESTLFFTSHNAKSQPLWRMLLCRSLGGIEFFCQKERTFSQIKGSKPLKEYQPNQETVFPEEFFDPPK